jgi:hypothetical protein
MESQTSELFVMLFIPMFFSVLSAMLFIIRILYLTVLMGSKKE